MIFGTFATFYLIVNSFANINLLKSTFYPSLPTQEVKSLLFVSLAKPALNPNTR